MLSRDQVAHKKYQRSDIVNSVLNVKVVVAAFNKEKALVGAFSVIVQPVVEPMDRFEALIVSVHVICEQTRLQTKLALPADS